MKVKIPTNAKNIMQKLIANKFEVYIVGGFVRDTLLGLTPNDVDLFTNATGEQILKLFPNGKVLGNEERQNKILTVIVNGVEVSQYRKNGNRTETGSNLMEHCATCDLSINSICMDINGKIIDYFNGQKDLTKGIIRAVGKPEDRFEEDYNRITRALVSKARFNFEINPETTIAIHNLKNKLKSLPIERIRDELIKIIKYPNAIEILRQYKLLEMFMEPIFNTIGVEGGDNHKETVYEHCIYTWQESLKLTDDWRIHMACLFHDIGKPNMLTKDSDGVHFYQHELEGYHIMKKWMTQMNFSHKDINFIVTLIRTHMQGYNNEMTKKSYLRFFKS